MSKEQQNKTAKETLLAKVAAITRKIEAADDNELKAWAGQLDADSNLKAEADATANAEKDNAQQSTGVDAPAAADDQNARANANWPAKTTMAASMVELARREAKTAAMMLAKAKEMVAEDDEEECVGCTAAAQSIVKTASDMMQMARDIMGEDDEEKSMPPWLEKKIGDKEANTKVASRLIAIAKQVMADEDEDEDEPEMDSGKEVAAALVNLAKTLAETKD
jgi:hypothetical protein